MKHALLAIPALLALPTAVACSSTPGGDAQQEPLGTVQAAVSALGPGGLTYSIPTSAGIVVNGNGNDFCAAIASTATESFTLPAGTYSFYLEPNGCGSTSIPPDAGTNVPFQLNATGADGGPAQSVAASLVNPVQSATVTPGGTAALTFVFATQTLGNITLGSGTVTTSIAVEAGAAAVGAISGSFAASLAAPQEMTGAGATMASTALFANPTPFQLSIGLGSLTAFTPNVYGQACASFTPTITATGATTGDSALFQEISASGSNGTICFDSPGASNFPTYGSSTPNAVVITISRQGSPVTTTIGNVLMPDGGAATENALIEILAATSAPVFNGSSLSTAQFQQGVTLTGGTTLAYVSTVINGNYNLVSGVTASGFSPTLTLNP